MRILAGELPDAQGPWRRLAARDPGVSLSGLPSFDPIRAQGQPLATAGRPARKARRGSGFFHDRRGVDARHSRRPVRRAVARAALGRQRPTTLRGLARGRARDGRRRP